jgi:hypothetical protein
MPPKGTVGGLCHPCPWPVDTVFSLCPLILPALSSFIWLFRVRTQGLKIASQTVYHLSHAPNPSLFYFASYLCLPYSWKYKHALPHLDYLLTWDGGGLTNFMLGLASNCDSSDLVSCVAGITEVRH